MAGTSSGSRAGPRRRTSTKSATSPTAHAVEAAAARVLERHPAIDLLVCNAGIAARARASWTATRADRAGDARQLPGSLWTVLAFLPGLGRGTHIVTIVSVAGTSRAVRTPRRSTRSSRSLGHWRSSSRPRGISVHTINPGLIETEGFQQRQQARSGSAGGSSPTRRSSPHGFSTRSSTTAARSSSLAGTGRSRGCRRSRPGRWRASGRYGRVSRNQPIVAS